MANKILGIVVVLLGLALLTRLFISGTFLFLIIGLVLALATKFGAIGRTGYALAAIFLILGFSGFALKGIFLTLAMLIKLAPLLLVLVGIYMLARSFGQRR